MPADFGVELTPRVVGAHLAAQRAARDGCHLDHPHESRMVLDVAAEAARRRARAR